jgi:hypothetical protein
MSILIGSRGEIPALLLILGDQFNDGLLERLAAGLFNDSALERRLASLLRSRHVLRGHSTREREKADKDENVSHLRPGIATG